MRAFFVKKVHEYLHDPQIIQALKRRNGKNLLETNLDLLIRWYAQVDDLGKDTYGYNILNRVQHFKVTERARDVLGRMMDKNKPLSTIQSEFFKTLIKATHYEHNAPVDVIKKRLLKLGINPTITRVEEVLRTDYEVIITSKEESKVLGGSKKKFYPLDGRATKGLAMSKTGNGNERLDAIGAGIISSTEKDKLISKLNVY